MPPEPRPWPELGTEGQWATELVDELLESPIESASELQNRARELREEARATELPGERDVAEALADRYQLAAERQREMNS
jgi:hypothetical protein